MFAIPTLIGSAKVLTVLGFVGGSAFAVHHLGNRNVEYQRAPSPATVCAPIGQGHRADLGDRGRQISLRHPGGDLHRRTPLSGHQMSYRPMTHGR